jgi:hypothetical protein
MNKEQDMANLNRVVAFVFSDKIFDFFLRPLFFVIGIGLVSLPAQDDRSFVRIQHDYYGGLLFAAVGLTLVAWFVIPQCVRRAPNMRHRGWGFVCYPGVAWAVLGFLSMMLLHSIDIGDPIGHWMCVAMVTLGGFVGGSMLMLSVVFRAEPEIEFAARLDDLHTKYNPAR